MMIGSGSHVEITHETQEGEVTVMGPLPTNEWKSTANDFIANWAQLPIPMALPSQLNHTCVTRL